MQPGARLLCGRRERVRNLHRADCEANKLREDEMPDMHKTIAELKAHENLQPVPPADEQSVLDICREIVRLGKKLESQLEEHQEYQKALDRWWRQ
jgi:hypothetical protein